MAEFKNPSRLGSVSVNKLGDIVEAGFRVAEQFSELSKNPGRGGQIARGDF